MSNQLYLFCGLCISALNNFVFAYFSFKFQSQGSIEDYNLTFSLIPALEEGGLSSTDAVRQPNDYLYALIPGGDEVEVNESNVFEFVKKYTEFKMRTAVQEPLEVRFLPVFLHFVPNV